MKSLLKFLCLLSTALLCGFIAIDLEDPHGYLQRIFLMLLPIFNLLLSAFQHLIEIANTPLASLTIWKIVLFGFYIVLLIWFLRELLSLVSTLLKLTWKMLAWLNKSSEKSSFSFSDIGTEEPSVERSNLDAEIEGEVFPNFIRRMQQSTSLEELDIFLYHAIGKWPQWEKQISQVYKARKDQLLKCKT